MAWFVVVAITTALIFVWRRLSAIETKLRRATKNLEAAISEASDARTEARYEFDALMQSCGLAVMRVGSEGTIVDANAEAEALFGGAEAVEGRSLLEATFSSELSRLAIATKPHHGPSRTRFEGPGGRSLNATIKALEIGGGSVVVVDDETRLRRLETMRRDFVANVSHELRTPLASIRAMAEAVLDGAIEEPAAARSFLKTIIRETDRLTRIAADLLTLSDAESREPARESVDVSSLLRDVAARFEAPAAKAGIKFDAHIAGGLRVAASQDQLEQAFVNLLDNAVKYTPEGGTVALSGDHIGDAVCVTVADTGIGIMQEHLPRVFERFYRVDEARARDSGGTGLGLAIVKHMTEANGGTVRVESEFNRGTRFTIELPESN